MLYKGKSVTLKCLLYLSISPLPFLFLRSFLRFFLLSFLLSFSLSFFLLVTVSLEVGRNHSPGKLQIWASAGGWSGKRREKTELVSKKPPSLKMEVSKELQSWIRASEKEKPQNVRKSMHCFSGIQKKKIIKGRKLKSCIF